MPKAHERTAISRLQVYLDKRIARRQRRERRVARFPAPGEGHAAVRDHFSKHTESICVLSLLDSVFSQCFDHGHILQKIWRQIVALHEVFGAVVRDPDFALVIFPNKHFQRKVNGDAGRG